MLEDVTVIIGYCNLHNIPFCYVVKKVRLTIVAQDHTEKKSEIHDLVPIEVFAHTYPYTAKIMV